MKRTIYADNAATTKLDLGALEAMRPYLLNQYANPSQPYSFARQAKQAIREARAQIAVCINADPEEIYFTSGGTESDNWAIKGIAYANKHKGKHIITSQIEHDSVLEACRALEREGFEVTYLPVDEYGLVSLASLLQRITADDLNLLLPRAEIKPQNFTAQIYDYYLTLEVNRMDGTWNKQAVLDVWWTVTDSRNKVLKRERTSLSAPLGKTYEDYAQVQSRLLGELSARIAAVLAKI